MTVRTAKASILVLVLAFGAGACEDMPAGPGGLEGITQSDGVDGNAGLSLRDLFAAAVFRVQREEGSDSAMAVLSRWRDARSDEGDEGDEAAARDPEVRAVEASTVLKVFGPGLVEHATAVVGLELAETQAKAERARVVGRNDRGLQSALDSAAAALSTARAAREGTPIRALLALDDAAERLSRARRVLADAERFPTLDELYRRALEQAGEAAGPTRAEDARLIDAADRAQIEGDLAGRYERLQALRSHRADFAVGVLGDTVCTRLLADVTAGLDELDAVLTGLDRSGADVLRDRRMLETASNIRDRAAAALEAGHPSLALDLGTHAASLLDELRRRRDR